ncbi:hypothetical protein NDU88_004574 [Pleurodeles waltl]|uniref:Uncharacterized protein n=1 Tax=Pleurodeles waltl TaxID=8319 RepID=A0AAV7V5I4_PLEWA|nr:hypothetical protein NDU88_004574 [Pleurodeles waltl]
MGVVASGGRAKSVYTEGGGEEAPLSTMGEVASGGREQSLFTEQTAEEAPLSTIGVVTSGGRIKSVSIERREVEAQLSTIGVVASGERAKSVYTEGGEEEALLSTMGVVASGGRAKSVYTEGGEEEASFLKREAEALLSTMGVVVLDGTEGGTSVSIDSGRVGVPSTKGGTEQVAPLESDEATGKNEGSPARDEYRSRRCVDVLFSNIWGFKEAEGVPSVSRDAGREGVPSTKGGAEQVATLESEEPIGKNEGSTARDEYRSSRCVEVLFCNIWGFKEAEGVPSVSRDAGREDVPSTKGETEQVATLGTDDIVGKNEGSTTRGGNRSNRDVDVLFSNIWGFKEAEGVPSVSRDAGREGVPSTKGGTEQVATLESDEAIGKNEGSTARGEYRSNRDVDALFCKIWGFKEAEGVPSVSRDAGREGVPSTKGETEQVATLGTDEIVGKNEGSTARGGNRSNRDVDVLFSNIWGFKEAEGVPSVSRDAGREGVPSTKGGTEQVATLESDEAIGKNEGSTARGEYRSNRDVDALFSKIWGFKEAEGVPSVSRDAGREGVPSTKGETEQVATLGTDEIVGKNEGSTARGGNRSNRDVDVLFSNIWGFKEAEAVPSVSRDAVREGVPSTKGGTEQVATLESDEVIGKNEGSTAREGYRSNRDVDVLFCNIWGFKEEEGVPSVSRDAGREGLPSTKWVTEQVAPLESDEAIGKNEGSTAREGYRSNRDVDVLFCNIWGFKEAEGVPSVSRDAGREDVPSTKGETEQVATLESDEVIGKNEGSTAREGYRSNRDVDVLFSNIWGFKEAEGVPSVSRDAVREGVPSTKGGTEQVATLESDEVIGKNEGSTAREGYRSNRDVDVLFCNIWGFKEAEGVPSVSRDAGREGVQSTKGGTEQVATLESDEVIGKNEGSTAREGYRSNRDVDVLFCNIWGFKEEEGVPSVSRDAGREDVPSTKGETEQVATLGTDEIVGKNEGSTARGGNRSNRDVDVLFSNIWGFKEAEGVPSVSRDAVREGVPSTKGGTEQVATLESDEAIGKNEGSTARFQPDPTSARDVAIHGTGLKNASPLTRHVSS